MAETDDYKVLNVSESAFKDFQAIMNRAEFKRISDLQNKHIFILAMALGFKNNKCMPITKRHQGGHCRVDTLSEEDKAIIKAIAITKNEDVNVLGNIKEQYQIAEMYANGGHSILKDIANEPGDFFINLSKELD